MHDSLQEQKRPTQLEIELIFFLNIPKHVHYVQTFRNFILHLTLLDSHNDRPD